MPVKQFDASARRERLNMNVENFRVIVVPEYDLETIVQVKEAPRDGKFRSGAIFDPQEGVATALVTGYGFQVQVMVKGEAAPFTQVLYAADRARDILGTYAGRKVPPLIAYPNAVSTPEVAPEVSESLPETGPEPLPETGKVEDAPVS